MTDTTNLGLTLLGMAGAALVLGLVATSNDAPTATTQALGLVTLLLALAGVVVFVLGLVRRRRG